MLAVVAARTVSDHASPVTRLSTYCLVAAWSALAGSALRVSGPAIVSPVVLTYRPSRNVVSTATVSAATVMPVPAPTSSVEPVRVRPAPAVTVAPDLAACHVVPSHQYRTFGLTVVSKYSWPLTGDDGAAARFWTTAFCNSLRARSIAVRNLRLMAPQLR